MVFQPVMSGLDTVNVLRSLGRRDLVVGVTGAIVQSVSSAISDIRP